MQCILCSLIECSGFNGAWLNAVDFMQHGPKHPDWMQWIPCSVIECRGFHALWRNGSRVYAAESMQRDDWMDSMQLIKMHPDWIQWIPCIVAKWIPIVCSGVHAAWWMHGFHAAWLNASRLNAVVYMQRDWMQWIPCRVKKWNPI